jgi:hypothetical protein
MTTAHQAMLPGGTEAGITRPMFEMFRVRALLLR